MKTLRGKLTYANVMVTILAFAVLGGGTAWAATHLAKNSVGAKQLRKGAVTAAKLSESAKQALIGAPGTPGSNGMAGAPGAAGSAGAPGAPATSEPLAIDASAPEQLLPSPDSFLTLDGRTSWTAPSAPAGLLVASLEVTAATNGLGGYDHQCTPIVEVFDNGERVLSVSAGVLYYTGGNLTPANYRTTSPPTPINVLNADTAQTITAKYSAATATDCAPGSKLDALRIIVQSLGGDL